MTRAPTWEVPPRGIAPPSPPVVTLRMAQESRKTHELFLIGEFNLVSDDS